MLFHRLEAWNLAYAMQQDGKVGFQTNPFIEHRFDDGRNNGWIVPQRVHEALEMFVVDDKPLLPSDLDIDIRPADGHLNWWNAIVESADQVMGRYQLDTMKALKGLILANLAERRVRISGAEFDAVLDHWQRIPTNIRWIQPGSTAGRGHKGLNPQQAYEIELEFKSVAISLELAGRGVPTYCHAPELVGLPAAPTNATDQAALGLAKFYFREQVRVPSPATFSDALKLRENQRVHDWREKLTFWSRELTSGSVKFDDISREIEDANNYIEGVGFPSRLIPRWASALIIPAAFAHTFMGGEWTHYIGIGVFAYELFTAFGEVITGSVTGPDPLQYKWFLLSNNS